MGPRLVCQHHHHLYGTWRRVNEINKD
jgi:hypothetical protein